MKNIWIICRKELKSYFSSPIAYGLMAFFAFVAGYFFWAATAIFVSRGMEMQMMGRGMPMDVNEWVVRPVLMNVSVIGLFLIPMMFLCAATVALWIEAVWWRMLLAIGLLYSFVGQMRQWLSDESLRSNEHWMTPTVGELLLLIATAVAGYLLTYRTVVRDRRGDTGSWENLEEYLHRLMVWLGGVMPGRVPAWSSATTASLNSSV